MSDFSTMSTGVKKFAAPASSEEPVSQADAIAKFMAGALAEEQAASEPENFPAPVNDEKPSVNSAIPFMYTETDEVECFNFVNGYNTNLTAINCMADSNLLSTYMTTMERNLGVTLSFEAYGIDPIVFHDLLKKQNSNTGCVSINIPVGADADGSPLEYIPESYEMLNIDGKLYLSCVTSVLDAEYLKSVIAQGVEALTMHNKFVYTYVGPRPIKIVGDDEEVENGVIETLKLNTKELSILLSCMKNISGVTYCSSVVDGHSCMVFTRE